MRPAFCLMDEAGLNGIVSQIPLIIRQLAELNFIIKWYCSPALSLTILIGTNPHEYSVRNLAILMWCIELYSWHYY